MVIHEVIGILIILVGAIVAGVGVLGLYKFYDFYSRAAIASVIDTAGFVLVLVGVMVYKSVAEFSLKIAVIIFFMLFLNPLSNHVIVRGAHRSGYDSEGQ